MKLNAEWHLTHPMPPRPTLEDRIHWHLAHAANCSCRIMPESIRKEIEARDLVVPTARSLR
ncbi:MAG: hypothetical protein EOP19_04610 [Hyphomicrobiales bacterium]|nr:MAG: hypothetical protein EOP19_04610 [Hyphomicrobiales bacterium]